MSDDPDAQLQEPVQVPVDALSEELLRSVVESFVLREGTDYGTTELSLDEKVARLIGELRRGKARIMFDPQSESIGIVVAKM